MFSHENLLDTFPLLPCFLKIMLIFPCGILLSKVAEKFFPSSFKLKENLNLAVDSSVNLF